MTNVDVVIPPILSAKNFNDENAGILDSLSQKFI